MPRRLIAFLVAFLLACSSAHAVARALAPALGDEHAAAHLASTAGHHHPDDSSVTPCECDDGVSDPALLAPIWPGVAPALPDAAPAEQPGAALPTPCLEGLKRPPRA